MVRVTDDDLMNMARKILELPTVSPFPCPTCKGDMGPGLAVGSQGWVCPKEECKVTLSNGKRATMLWNYEPMGGTFHLTLEEGKK